MRSPLFVALAAGTLAALSACTTSTTIIQPATFERPADIAFVCYSTADGSFLPLADCDDLPEQGADLEDQEKTLLALVTQTARGEIATVNLMSELVIDADVRVPGYTFVRVGEIPSAIVVPPEAPERTYVASYGGRRVESYDTARFDPEIEPSRERETDVDQVWLPAAPADLVLGPAGDVLYAALPDDGSIVRIELDAEGRLVQPSDADAVVLDPGTPTLGVVPPAGREYDRLCPSDADLGLAPAASPREPRTLGDVARPVELLVVEDELLVADALRPMIHRYAIADDGTLSALDPLHVGVPTTRLVVTPEVPENFSGDVASEPARYLYAIDATDGSVMAIDYLASSPTFGAVLAVSVGLVPDRIPLRAAAQSLEVITPGYPGSLCAFDDGNEDDRLPTILRGVFLAVGQIDGVMAMVDVLDLDAGCRGGAGCADPEWSDDERVFIRRHQTRVGDLVSSPIAVIGTLLFSFDGSNGRLDSDGRPTTGVGPGLSLLSACPTGTDAVFPSTDSEVPMVCATVDPFVARAQRWTATYRGSVPTAVGAAGRLSGSTVTIDGHGLCERGVLGSEDVSGLDAAEPEAGYAGDALVVESDPRTDASGCEAFYEDDDGERTEISVPILRAYGDHLELDSSAAGFANLARCFPDEAPFAWRIDVREAFAVTGAIAGFDHRVIPADEDDESSACVVDVAGQPVEEGRPGTWRNSRALRGQLFRNHALAFQIDQEGTLANDSTAVLTFQVGVVPTPLDVDVAAVAGTTGGVVSRIAFDATRDMLYVIDSSGDALVEYDLTPLQSIDIYD